MIENRWFCEPDDERESWGFFSLERKESGEAETVTGWKIGYGNPEKMVRKVSNKRSDEREVLKELAKELSYCRQNQVLFVTYEPTLPVIRTRTVILGLKEVGLRGIKHMCLEKVLERYFSGLPGRGDLRQISDLLGLIELGEERSSEPEQLELLRRVLLAVGPLLPKKRFRQKPT